MTERNRRNSYRIGCSPGYQEPRPMSGSQGMVEKLDTGASLETEIPRVEGALRTTGNTKVQLRKETRIGTWNVRSLLEEGKLDLLEHQLDRYRIQICGLTEVWWKKKGHFTTDNGHKVVYSGHDEVQRQGVALWMNREVAKSLLSYEPINSRLISVRLQASPVNITIIVAYAPSQTGDTEADEEERNRFYDEIQKAIDNAPQRSVKFVIGDFNAKIGESQSQLPTVGQYGLGERNAAGDCLYSFCAGNSLSIANTLFKQPKRRLYTWQSPNGYTRNQIDYIMVHSRYRKYVKTCHTYPGADCNSDHNLLMAIFKGRFVNTRPRCQPLRLDLNALAGPQGNVYATEVTNRFEALNLIEGESTPQELWQQTKDILLGTAKDLLSAKSKPSSNRWISDATVQKAEEKRKAKSTNPTKYKQLKAEVQRMVRRDKQAFTDNVCSQIEAQSKKGNTRELFKQVRRLTNERKVTLNMIKSENGDTLIEPKAIAGRWKEYTAQLYRDTPSSAPTNMQPIKEPPPLKSEIEKALNSINSNKAPGSDKVPAELLRYGGETTLEAMHKICEGIWETGEWPDDWVNSVFIPIPKKGDLTKCGNYRTISLVSHASKVLLKVILNRIQKKTEEELPDEQAGFRPNRGTRDQITNLRVLMAKMKEHNQPLYMCFIDFQKAFDSVQHEKLWWAMLDMGFPPHLVQLLSSLYKNQKACVRIAGVLSDWFSIQKGVRQGCILSPYLFNIVSETVMRKALENYRGGVIIGGRKITNLRYADDIVLLASSVTELQDLVDRVARAGREHNLQINASKTKAMSLNGDTTDIKIDGVQIEQVHKFPYLGAMITDDAKAETDLKQRLAIGATIMAKLKPLWKSHALTLETKIKMCKVMVWPVVTYGSESWVLRKDEEKRLEAFEMKMLRKILGVTWQEHRTNESILEQTGHKKGLLPAVRKKKLTYAGHIARCRDSLEKTIMQGSVPGKRGRGRPRRTWMDDITEWTGLSAEKCERAAVDRPRWRKIVGDAA